ncbi:MAG: CHAT domain-containing protein, partial [Cyanobacteriota bacterium]|nr:CHAT domain-containing protein [Cyanobacteriota bacterium]
QSQTLDPSPMTKAEAIAVLEANFQSAAILDLTNIKKWGMKLRDNERLTWEEIGNLSLSSHGLIRLPPGGVKMAQCAQQLLHRGVAWVLLGLWETEAQASFLLSAEFYRRLKNGANPAAALQQSQRWLSKATDRDLAQWQRDRAREIASQPQSAELENRARFLEENPAKMGADRPRYEHPYYWAGQIALG